MTWVIMDSSNILSRVSHPTRIQRQHKHTELEQRSDELTVKSNSSALQE
jgi:hypothetical protein